MSRPALQITPLMSRQTKGSDMQHHHTPLAGEPRLRVVFANKSIAVGLPDGATLGEVAEWVGDIARRHNGSLRSIDVKMTGRRARLPTQPTDCVRQPNQRGSRPILDRRA